MGDIQLLGWKTTLPFYVIYCPSHGLQITYPSGYGQKLVCPRCLKEEGKKFS